MNTKELAVLLMCVMVISSFLTIVASRHYCYCPPCDYYFPGGSCRCAVLLCARHRRDTRAQLGPLLRVLRQKLLLSMHALRGSSASFSEGSELEVPTKELRPGLRNLLQQHPLAEMDDQGHVSVMRTT